MAKSAIELNGMLVEEIEEHGKKLHQLTEEYEAACKAGDAFEAHYVIGKLQSVMFALKTMAVKCHGMNRVDITEQEMHDREFRRFARGSDDN